MDFDTWVNELIQIALDNDYQRFLNKSLCAAIYESGCFSPADAFSEILRIDAKNEAE